MSHHSARSTPRGPSRLTPDRGFAVIGLEATGLSPRLHDRVIEIAVVHVDETGTVTGRWETVVDPERDLDTGHVRGIRAADVIRAPRFADVAPQLVELLNGRVLVAHDASFQLRFLVDELERTGYDLPAEVVEGTLCTMRLARDFLPGAGRALRDCCAAYDIEPGESHRAAVDALAAAHLLAAYLGASPFPESWTRLLDRAPDLSPHPAVTVAEIDRGWMARPVSSVPPVVADDFLARISEKLPAYSGPADHLDYLALLDRCLLDHRLSPRETDALVVLADELGIGPRGAATLHRRYFDDLAGMAWADGVLTHHELAELHVVAEFLRIPVAAVAEAIDPRSWAARRGALSGAGAASEADAPRRGRHRAGDHGEEGFSLERGDVVALTGHMSRPRGELEAELRAAGFRVAPGVTRSTRLLVASDPDSRSGKARKARDYGVMIVSDEVLWRVLGKGTAPGHAEHAVA